MVKCSSKVDVWMYIVSFQIIERKTMTIFTTSVFTRWRRHYWRSLAINLRTPWQLDQWWQILSSHPCYWRSLRRYPQNRWTVHLFFWRFFSVGSQQLAWLFFLTLVFPTTKKSVNYGLKSTPVTIISLKKKMINKIKEDIMI